MNSDDNALRDAIKKKIKEKIKKELLEEVYTELQLEELQEELTTEIIKAKPLGHSKENEIFVSKYFFIVKAIKSDN